SKEVNMSILVAYDGSDVAKEAFALAQKHARAFKQDIEVVRAVEREATLDLGNIQRLEDELENEIRLLLADDKIPFKTTLLVSSSTPAEEIVRHAEVKKSTEIVMGARKRSKVGKLVFGSTAQYVILNAPCPVVITK
ncbi:MAG: universal stress protein, partial [Desulfobacterales bacterium]